MRGLQAPPCPQFMQKKSPLYVLLKEDTVWSMDHLNRYINDKFRKTKGLPRDWVFTAFTVCVPGGRDQGPWGAQGRGSAGAGRRRSWGGRARPDRRVRVCAGARAVGAGFGAVSISLSQSGNSRDTTFTIGSAWVSGLRTFTGSCGYHHLTAQHLHLPPKKPSPSAVTAFALPPRPEATADSRSGSFM